MSIPKVDPNFTLDMLQEVGKEFLDAGYKYWEAMHKSGVPCGAVCWLTDLDGRMAIFTRGEYRDTIMRNIEKIGRVTHFGAVDDEKDIDS